MSRKQFFSKAANFNCPVAGESFINRKYARHLFAAPEKSKNQTALVFPDDFLFELIKPANQSEILRLEIKRRNDFSKPARNRAFLKNRCKTAQAKRHKSFGAKKSVLLFILSPGNRLKIFPYKLFAGLSRISGQQVLLVLLSLSSKPLANKAKTKYLYL